MQVCANLCLSLSNNVCLYHRDSVTSVARMGQRQPPAAPIRQTTPRPSPSTPSSRSFSSSSSSFASFSPSDSFSSPSSFLDQISPKSTRYDFTQGTPTQVCPHPLHTRKCVPRKTFSSSSLCQNAHGGKGGGEVSFSALEHGTKEDFELMTQVYSLSFLRTHTHTRAVRTHVYISPPQTHIHTPAHAHAHTHTL